MKTADFRPVGRCEWTSIISTTAELDHNYDGKLNPMTFKFDLERPKVKANIILNILAMTRSFSSKVTYDTPDRHSVPATTFQTLIVSLVLSRLDYGNAVLAGLPGYLFQRLQSVMNAAARLIYGLRHSDHISDALISLHWLRAQERVRLKTAVLMYKATHGTAPS